MSVSVGISGGVGCGGLSAGVSVGGSGCGGVGVSVGGNVGVSSGYGGGVSVGVSGCSGASVHVGGGIGVSSNVGVGVGVSTSSVSVGLSVSADIEPPNTTEQLTDSLRSFPVCAVCTLCKGVGATTITPSWNILNCLFAYFCTEFWCCYMCFKRKDWNCFNARHACTDCGKYIDTYHAC